MALSILIDGTPVYVVSEFFTDVPYMRSLAARVSERAYLLSFRTDANARLMDTLWDENCLAVAQWGKCAPAPPAAESPLSAFTHPDCRRMTAVEDIRLLRKQMEELKSRVPLCSLCQTTKDDAYFCRRCPCVTCQDCLLAGMKQRPKARDKIPWFCRGCGDASSTVW